MRHLIQTAFVAICLIGLIPGAMPQARADDAGKRAEIDSAVDAALTSLYTRVPGSKEVTKKAAGVLVFPSITKAGFVFGGESGDGSLRIKGKTAGYYKTGGLSFGLQAGVEQRSMAIVFLTKDALQNFQNSDGWDAGADASVALVQAGAGGKANTAQMNKPVQVYVYGNKGLMGSISLEGTKITKLGL